MAVTNTFASGKTSNMVREFVADTVADIADIRISQLLPGSKVFVIEDSQWYMLNSSQVWKSVKNISGGGESSDSGGDSDSNSDVIYEGGDLDNETDNSIIYEGGDLDNG